MVIKLKDMSNKWKVLNMKMIPYILNMVLLKTKLFQPTINGIIQCTVDSLEEMKSRVDTIYLVGGFGGYQYIYKKLEESIYKCNEKHLLQ